MTRDDYDTRTHAAEAAGAFLDAQRDRKNVKPVNPCAPCSATGSTRRYITSGGSAVKHAPCNCCDGRREHRDGPCPEQKGNRP
ncbi:hypothetical protein [Streptomyces sp. URMC 123]|uniref:hypothetical protein n=1 Tax=Streptomyces sp. URMC 123 TaxID=3423403 RepID=UPI003F1C1083